MIELQNIQTNFLSNINLKVKRNELLILKGASGSGKSTLLHLIAAFAKPTSGKIVVNEENIAALQDYHASLYRRDTLSYVTQNFYLLDTLSVAQNLLPALVLHKLSLRESQERIKEVLKLVDLLKKSQQKVSTLSGGERQRLVIARALINETQILVCDEPTANLDSKNSEIFLEILLALKKRGKTIIIATHDPIFDTFSGVDRVVQMRDGHLE